MTILQPKTPDRTSLRAAINAKCRDCIHDEVAPGNWRQQVGGCTCRTCPLYPVRPLSKGAGKAPEIDIGAIREGGR